MHNQFNPDASRRVPWGFQTYDEMLFAPFTYTLDKENTNNIIHSAEKTMFARQKGFYDKNWDGMLSWDEVPKGERKRYYPIFHRGDINADDMLVLIFLFNDRSLTISFLIPRFPFNEGIFMFAIL